MGGVLPRGTGRRQSFCRKANELWCEAGGGISGRKERDRSGTGRSADLTLPCPPQNHVPRTHFLLILEVINALSKKSSTCRKESIGRNCKSPVTLPLKDVYSMLSFGQPLSIDPAGWGSGHCLPPLGCGPHSQRGRSGKARNLDSLFSW